MCTPITSAALSACTNSYSIKLGEGATGEVFSGVIHGVPVAVKRLKAPGDASSEVLASLRRRFRAELGTLSAFQHPRIVQLLHSCEDTGDRSHPFALAFELLEQGSLAEWLRSGRGEPAKRGSLSCHQRLDAALGIAHGLKYLHGLPSEEGEGGAQGEPVVHRDVKSANVGFALTKDGSLYAKVIDCGLAKALRGGAPAAMGGGGGSGASFSSGVLGTPGYMAPELTGVPPCYSIASEVYSFGVVLLELLMGAVVGEGTASAQSLVKAASQPRAAPKGVAAFAERADAVWTPPEARDALAALVMDCVAQYEEDRPADMAAVLARLKAIKALLSPPGQPPAPMEECGVCMEEVEVASGTHCKGPAPQHFCCHGCLQRHVKDSVSVEKLARNAGGIPCVSAGCAGEPFVLEELLEDLDKGALAVYAAGMRYYAMDLPKLIARREAERVAKEEEIRRIADLGERVRRLRLCIAEDELTFHCPRCKGAFLDFSGCAALYCKDDAGPPPRKGCGISFCALCMKDCEGDAHKHVKEAHADPALKKEGNPAMYFFTEARYKQEHKARRLGLLAARLQGLAGEPEVQERLLAELGKADLAGVGITVQELRGAAGMGEKVEVKKMEVGKKAEEGGWVCSNCTLVIKSAAHYCTGTPT